QARNPKTGEQVVVPDHYVPTFKFSKEFKEMVNQVMKEKEGEVGMVRFCPECGTELKRDFKFCPSCGYNLKEVRSSRTGEEKFIECESCGTENPVDASVCSGCGI